MHDDDDDDLDLAAVGKKPTWLLVLFLLGLVGGAGFLAWRVMTTLEPTRVLVAIDVEGHWFEGSKPAANLADRLNGQLEVLGFDPVRPGDPETLAALDGAGDDLLAAARKLKAAYVVRGRLVPKKTAHELGDGYHSIVLSGRVEVTHAAEGGDGSGEVHTWSGAPKAERAMQLAVRSAAQQASAEAIPLLLAHPVVAALLDSDVKTMGKLRAAQKFAQLRSRELRTAEKTYAAYEGRRKAAEKGPVEVTYHGPMSAEDRLGGAGPNGFLVMTEGIRPYVTPRNTKLGYFEQLETLEWRHPGGEKRTLWEGYNVYSYPSASNDGLAAAFVEDVFGMAKTVTVVGPDGEAKRVVVDEKHRFSTPRPSAKGTYVAAYDRECRRCDDGLLLMRVADGAKVFSAPHEDGVFGGYTWLDETRLALLHTPKGPADPETKRSEVPLDPDDPRVFPAHLQTVWLIDAAAEPPTPTALFTVPEGGRLRQISSNAKGDTLVFKFQGTETAGVALLPVAAPALKVLPVGRRIDWPKLSPDGTHVAFSIGRRSREDIAVMSTSGGDPKLLTKNPERDRYPAFSADGSRIFFETLGDDPNFTDRRHSFVASVPFTP